VIPKLIWQTHEAKYKELPSFQKNIINTWKNLNPGWQHIYADAEQRSEDIKYFDKTLYKSYLKSSKVTQADMWRYVMMYQNGGVYADMDSVCRKPIDYFFKNINSGVLSNTTYNFLSDASGESLEVNNSNFGAIKNSQTMKDVLEDIIFGYRMLLEEYTPGREVIPKYNCWEAFGHNVIKNKDFVIFDFDCSIHDKAYKQEFRDYYVDYHGNQFLYKELAKLSDWRIF